MEVFVAWFSVKSILQDHVHKKNCSTNWFFYVNKKAEERWVKQNTILNYKWERKTSTGRIFGVLYIGLLFYCFDLLFLFKMRFCIKIPLKENCLNDTGNLRSSLELRPSFLITRALPLIAVIQTYIILILFFLQYVPWNRVIIINIKIYIDYLYTLPTLICQSWINWFQF